MSVAVTESIKCKGCGSRKASNFDTESLFATQVCGLASHDDGRGTKELLKSRTHERAKVVHSCADSRTRRSNVEVRGPNGRNKSETSIRDLSILRIALCRRCLSEGALAATNTRKIVPFDFELSSQGTGEGRHGPGSLPGITTWTKSVTDGGGAAPSVLTLSVIQLRIVVKDMGSP